MAWWEMVTGRPAKAVPPGRPIGSNHGLPAYKRRDLFRQTPPRRQATIVLPRPCCWFIAIDAFGSGGRGEELSTIRRPSGAAWAVVK